jgi:hypothetical protein
MVDCYPEAPEWGAEFLERGRRFEARAEEEIVAGLNSGRLGFRARGLYLGIGQSLSLLTVAASCGHGCRSTNHLFENITRRFVNFALAALRLACRGYYDESVALIRNASEILNLLQLFCADPSTKAGWSTLSERDRRREFTPVKVRLRLEEHGHSPLIDEHAYAMLCEAGVHLSPDSARQSHDLEGERVYVGPYPSVPGVILVLSELAYVIAHGLSFVGQLLDMPQEYMAASAKAMAELLQEVGRGEMRIVNYKTALAWFKQQCST